MDERGGSRFLVWSFWIPAATLAVVELYASGFDGWGAWATAPLFLVPLGLSFLLTVAGLVQCVRAVRAGASPRSSAVLTAGAALPLIWLLVRRYVV